jgi:flavodoxin
MRSIIQCSLVTLLWFCYIGCSNAQTVKKRGRILIVYLSRTNNTKAIAEIIHRKTGGELSAIELKKPYPEDYRATVQQVVEENESGYLPELMSKIDSISNYDIVFVGFPTWGMQLPPPVKSFLTEYDLGDKTVIPFNTNAGYGTGSSFQTVKRLCPRSIVLEGFSMEGGKERDGIKLAIAGDKLQEAETAVSAWLNKIGIQSTAAN